VKHGDVIFVRVGIAFNMTTEIN